MAAAYEILGENQFKVIAYDKAADSIEHATSEIKDLWDDGKLDTVPGIGKSISEHLDELFKTGKVKHFETVMKKVPTGVFPLLGVPGLGPKKAFKLAKILKLNNPKTVIADLAKAAETHKIAGLEGFGEKSESDILVSIEIFNKGAVKENRMELPMADSIAQEVIFYLKKLSAVQKIDVLGSLRREVSTIGDIDIAVATTKPKEIIDYFVKFPHQKLIEQGPTGASLLLHNGRQVDLRVADPKTYGAMLQYFTGSKNHNIKLRTWALSKGLSLSEYGIKNTDTGKTSTYATEEEFYKALKLPWIPPELREDKGELEAALRQVQGKPDGLPKLVELKDIKGDLHIHTSFDLEPSHDLGASPLTDYLDRAAELGYEYIGISDHNPSTGNHSPEKITEIMKKRQSFYKNELAKWQQNYKNKSLRDRSDGEAISQNKYGIAASPAKQDPRNDIKGIFIMCEVDIQPDGRLALPDKAFDFVDAVIVSVHTVFNQSKEVMTKRVIVGMTAHPKVRILGHPTGRLLARREGYELDWEKIFETCRKNKIALEINAHPVRLDLPDTIVYEAVKKGLIFCIDTDSHQVDQMSVMKYGVSVARRGWATKNDIVNTLEYNKFKDWLVK